MSSVAQSTGAGIEKLCTLLGKSRQAYYQLVRGDEKRALEEEKVIQQVLAHRKRQPRLGGRKLHYLLSDFIKQEQISMGRDAFYGLLSQHGLLLKRRKGRPRTTDSRHGFGLHPNLARGFTPLSSHRLWVCDITYIAIQESGYAYLSLITDAYSRKIIGYCLRPDLTAEGPLSALRQALSQWPGKEPLIHHSDRGVQYCCRQYMQLLEAKGILASTTENGDPRENALAERVNGILKEELLAKSYASFQEAEAAIALAIHIYNGERPHASLDMLTPHLAHSMSGELKKRWSPPKYAATNQIPAVNLQTD